MKKLTYFLEILLISGLFASPVFGAQSFAGFSANNTLGSQIADGLIQNMVNVTLEETSAGKYSINIVNVAECSFTMGGVTFWFPPTQAGQTAYKTYNNYIQPNGNNREIRIPTMPGERVKIVLMEDCDDVLVDGVSQALSAGENTLIATGNNLILRTQNGYKPKINAIVPYEDVYTIVSSRFIVGVDWITDAANNMIYDENTGIYTLVKENMSIPAGRYDYDVVENQVSGTYAYPTSEHTLDILENGVYTITFTYDPSTSALSAVVVKTGDTMVPTHIYAVVGDEEIARYDWEPWAEDNKMTSTDGGITYTLVITNAEVRTGHYNYQIVEFGTWDKYDDAAVDVSESGIYTITYTLVVSTHVSKVTFEKTGNMDGEHGEYIEYNSEDRWSIVARSNDCSLGIAVGGGWYIPNTQVNLIAIPYEGSVFVKWSDNVTDNPRSVIVNSNDGYYEAIFRKTDQYKSYDFDEDYLDYKPYSENQDISSGGGNNGSNGNSGSKEQQEVPHAPFPFVVYGWKVR